MSIATALIRDGLPATLRAAPPKEVWLAVRPDAAPGDGTRTNPYDASTAAKFDALLDTNSGKIGQETLIHFGPGIFRTKGWTASAGGRGWQVQSGQAFRGAGVYQTVIRLQLETSDYDSLNAVRVFTVFSSFGFLDAGAEISDLTIDLNLQGQPDPASGGPYPNIMVSGVDLSGSNIRLTRVRVIGFGTRAIDRECFPMRVGGYGGTQASPKVAANAQIDRCSIEQPYPSNIREATLALVAIGTDSHGYPKNLYTRNEGIRRCYFNLDLVNRDPAPATHVKNIFRTPGSGVITFETDYPHNVKVDSFIEVFGSTNTNYNKRKKVTSLSGSPTDGSSRILQVDYGSDPGAPTGGHITLQESLPPTIRASIAYNAGVYEVTTVLPHNRETDEWVVITDAANAAYNGTFKITYIDRYKFSFTPEGSPMAADLVWLDRRFSGFIRLHSITRMGGAVVLVETETPHLRKPGDWVVISGIGGPDANLYNGYFVVMATPGPTAKTFRLTLTAAPTNDPVVPETYVGEELHATSADAGYGLIMERNRIHNCRVGGTYHDTWSTDEYISRRNYYSNVWTGPRQNLGGTEQGNVDASFVTLYRTASVVSSSGVSPVMIALTNDPKLLVGDGLNVQSGSINEFVAVLNVAYSSGTNKWEITFASALSYTNGQTAVFYVYFRVRRQILIEENIFDLAPMITENSAAPAAIDAAGRYTGSVPSLVGQTNPYTFKQVIVRGNLIRKVNDQADGIFYSGQNVAIHVDSAENAIIENNIIGQLQANPTTGWALRYSNCGTIKAFNNQDNTGKLIQLWNDDRYLNNKAEFYDDLLNEAEDWLLGF